MAGAVEAGRRIDEGEGAIDEKKEEKEGEMGRMRKRKGKNEEGQKKGKNLFWRWQLRSSRPVSLFRLDSLV